MFGVKEKLRKEKRVKLSDLVAFLYCVDMSYLDVSVEHPGGDAAAVDVLKLQAVMEGNDISEGEMGESAALIDCQIVGR